MVCTTPFRELEARASHPPPPRALLPPLQSFIQVNKHDKWMECCATQQIFAVTTSAHTHTQVDEKPPHYTLNERKRSVYPVFQLSLPARLMTGEQSLISSRLYPLPPCPQIVAPLSQKPFLHASVIVWVSLLCECLLRQEHPLAKIYVCRRRETVKCITFRRAVTCRAVITITRG
ncbi:hypothetical protein CEXT_487231 [Caerostris extrusa]|uniref:Uncharacterized protein n=1 Tax=Caerostris extrusa TaxID=172846 RepID=A0AAV4MGB4_CAEEX|nr:hypothetical protein CEXT_487231 [Caerostris extrusa]